jgi:4-amino-4-deoxy-L-arabinose transferase-like glycosyltransferase
VFLVGAAGFTLGGGSADAPIVALNLVFVPLLVGGCYGIGRIAFDDARAGVLAAAFALAAPVVIGQFHIFLLDLPLTAMVAATGWAILASDRFDDRRLSLLVGVLAGLGLLTKQSFVLFIAPLVLVVLLRGGYRNWRNVLMCAGLALLIAGPWYVQHLHGLTRVAQEATTQGAGINPYGPEYPRGSLRNFAWYAWTALNTHYFLPLVLFYLTGLVHGLVSWARTRRAGYLPELIASSVGAYVAVAMLWGFQDARYSIPAVPFVAALGTGWILSLRRGPRLVATAALVAVLLCNMVAVNLDPFGTVDVRLPGADRPGREWVENRVVLFRGAGYSSGPPHAAARTLDVLRAARREGVTAFAYANDAESLQHISPNGLFYYGLVAHVGLVPPERLSGYGRRGVLFAARPDSRHGPTPCTRFDDGTGLYLMRGNAAAGNAFRQSSYCPFR